MHLRSRRAAAVLLVAAAATAAAALETPVGNGNVVTATIQSASDRSTFLVACPAGASLSVTVKGVKKKGATTPAPRFDVRDPNFTVVGDDKIVTNPTGASAKAIPIAASGGYRIAVTAGGGATGDFQLTATWKSPTSVPLSGVLAAGESTIAFSADAGAVATFDVSAATKSSALPRLVRVDGPSFSNVFAPPAAGAKRQHAAGITLPATGDYVLHVQDGGAVGGAFTGKISIKPPKAVKAKLLLTNASLGASTDQFAQVTTIPSSGGTAATGDAGVGPIDGASVSVPAGALAASTTLVVGSAPPIAGQDAAAAASGPTVFFGPEGLKFKAPVTLTIPFDPAPFGGDFSSLQVFTRDAKGKVTKVTSPLTVDSVAGTISFSSSHFSSYRAFGPKRHVRGDVNGDGFADLILPAPGDAEGRGAVYVYFGRADFLTNPPTAPDLTFIGVSMGDGFGSAVATGDANGDGVDDLIVGSKHAGSGKVSVFFGGGGLKSHDSADADVTLSGGTGDSQFGATVVVGDVTGDGIADVIVAAPYTSSTGTENGVVYVFPGSLEFSPATSTDSSVIAITGDGDLEHLGSAMAVGDLTNDGIADLAIGNQDIAELAAGRVHVVVGGPNLASQTVAVSTIDFTGTNHFDHFGDAIAIGDFNADGIPDLAVGAPYEDDPSGTTDTGAVHVFYGKTGFAGADASASDRVFRLGQNAADLFGSYLAAGNVEGSAAADLIATAPGYDAGGGDEGDVWVLLGGAGFAIRADGYAVYAPNDQMGVLLQPVDLDGDGRDEIVAASPGHDSGAGLVDVRFGPNIATERSVKFNGTPGQRLGGRD